MKILVNCLEVDMGKAITKVLTSAIPDIEIVNVGTEVHCDHTGSQILLGDHSFVGIGNCSVPTLKGTPLGTLNRISSGRSVGKSHISKMHLEYMEDLCSFIHPKQKPDKSWYRKLEKTSKRKHYKNK